MWIGPTKILENMLVKIFALFREHSIITLLQNAQNLDPLPPCLRLFNSGSPLPPDVQNLTSTPSPNTFTTTHYKNSKLCDFIVLYPVVISSCKYHKKSFSERSPLSPEYKWY